MKHDVQGTERVKRIEGDPFEADAEKSAECGGMDLIEMAKAARAARQGAHQHD